MYNADMSVNPRNQTATMPKQNIRGDTKRIMTIIINIDNKKIEIKTEEEFKPINPLNHNWWKTPQITCEVKKQ